MRAQEFIDETINPDVLDSQFHHIQEIGDYTYTAYTEQVPDGPTMLYIKAFDGHKLVGKVGFYVGWGADDALHSSMTVVDPAYKKQGIASTMYAYAKMLGNDIVPSASQLPPGKKMWAAWKKSGQAKHIMPEPVNELFQPGKEWKWAFRGSEEAAAEFRVGNIDYIWHAYSGGAKRATSWLVEFKVKDEADQDKMFGLTGTGNAAEVMSIVTDITRAFLKEYANRIREISFLSIEESRSKLYARMIKRLLPDWEMEAYPSGQGLVFYVINPNISQK